MNRCRSCWFLMALLVLSASAAQAQAPAPAAEGSARRARLSWTSDRRNFQTGDVLTVLVDENTLATASRGNFASDRRIRDMMASASQNVVRSLPSVGADLASSNEAESRQRGESTRHNSFRGEMSVRVVEVEPSGLIRIEGRKLLTVDDNSEELVLSGVVRPQDVSHDNLVDSWRIADAELIYTSKGSLDKPRGGILGRMLGKIWP